MSTRQNRDTAMADVRALCEVEPDRRPGSPGNDAAIDHVIRRLSESGWDPSEQSFPCLDWTTSGGELHVADRHLEVAPSPYGCGTEGRGPLRIVRDRADLDRRDLAGSVLVVAGPLAVEPLTPRDYPFYENDDHRAILDGLLAASPLAILALTGMAPGVAGAVRPFPLIEDGTVAVPAAAVDKATSGWILDHEGEPATIEIRSDRHPSTARNVLVRRGPSFGRVLVMAHIDTKPGTPGAVDNACGVAALLQVADALAGRNDAPTCGVELLVVNGEDHFAAPGEVAWLEAQDGRLDAISLAINIDGIGYRHGQPHYSTYNLRGAVERRARQALDAHFPEGAQWFQSDHAIFAMAGRPAIAVTSEPIAEAMATIFHTPDDTTDMVDVAQVGNVAAAIIDVLAVWGT